MNHSHKQTNEGDDIYHRKQTRLIVTNNSPYNTIPRENNLTHWGRVTHIFVSKLTTIDSGNGLSPGRHQAIVWTNAGILLIEPLGRVFSETFIETQAFSFKKMHLKMSSGKCRPFCLGLNVSNIFNLCWKMVYRCTIDTTTTGLLLMYGWPFCVTTQDYFKHCKNVKYQKHGVVTHWNTKSNDLTKDYSPIAISGHANHHCGCRYSSMYVIKTPMKSMHGWGISTTVLCDIITNPCLNAIAG